MRAHFVNYKSLVAHEQSLASRVVRPGPSHDYAGDAAKTASCVVNNLVKMTAAMNCDLRFTRHLN